MQAIEKEQVEPLEVGTLREIFQEEYPDAEIKYVNYTDRPIEQIGVVADPIIIGGSDDVWVRPTGRDMGNYRLPMFINGAKNRLPDPENPNNSYILYPSFDEKDKVKTLRILKYTNNVLDEVVKEATGSRIDLHNSYQKHKNHMVIPIVRLMSKRRADGRHVFTERFPTYSSSVLEAYYSPERLSKIRKGSGTLPWGEGKELVRYQNKDGGKRILVVTQSLLN